VRVGNRDPDRRRVFGTTLLLTVAVACNGNLILWEICQDNPARVNDWISKSERRYEKLRYFLPKQGEIGYITDPDHDLQIRRYPAEQSCGFPVSELPTKLCYLAYERFFLAQYSLVPLRVRYGTDPPYVIGNFTSPKVAAQHRFPRGLVMIKDFGGGLVLYRRTGA
jgi:hypothetical protein